MTERLSYYELLDKLGIGGMGTVWRARDRRDASVVAVKVLHPHLAADEQYVRRFQREVAIARGIDSPNVVKVLDSGFESDVHFLVMEYVPGKTLMQLVQEHGRLPVDQAVLIARDVARGLVAAHQRGIVHRDVSPQNVIITTSGAVKLTDFGVARDLAQTAMTATSMVLGKPEYLAPEAVTGSVKPDIRADIYAVGIVLFQMLTGQVPFHADTPYAVLHKHLVEPPPRVATVRPETPPWLESVILRCIAKDPADRFATPDALVQALATHQQVTPVRSRGQPSRRRPVLAAVCAVAGSAAVMAVVGLVLMRSGDDSRATTQSSAAAAAPDIPPAVTANASEPPVPPEAHPSEVAELVPAPPVEASSPPVPVQTAPRPLAPPVAQPAAVAQSLIFDSRLESGATGCCAPATQIPYRFVLQGERLPSLEDLRMRLSSTPPLPGGIGTRPPSYVIIYIPPATRTQVYRLTLQLANGQTVTAELAHVQTPQPAIVMQFEGKLAANDPLVRCQGVSNYKFRVPGLKDFGSIGDGNGYATATSGITINGAALGSGDFMCWRRTQDDYLVVGLTQQAARGMKTVNLRIQDGRSASVSFEHTP